MKLAKKVLSVVLALAIALGAFAVVGSAAGNPDGDYQVKIWLTGAVGSATWTTNSKVTIDEGDESAAGAEIEVQPGDTVFVRFYITNNYYVHTFQTNVFYSAGLIDAAEIYQAQRSRAITTANLKKIHIWNEDHYWAGLQGTSYSNQNPWSILTEEFQQNIAQNWPTDDDGNNLLDMSEWKFAIFSNLATEGVGETSIFDDDSTHLFMMPLTIPDDAQPGDKFYVTIPEGLEQREAKKYGALRLSEIGIADGEDEPCDLVDTAAALTPNFSYGSDNQYYDLSEATLTLVVPGSSEPEINTADLEKAIADAANLLTADITADSKTALNAAITEGNEALTSNDQTVIDDATLALTDAIENVEYLANFTALNEALTEYAGLNSADWDATSWSAVEAAQKVAAAIDQTNTGATQQTAVDKAANDLATAIDNLAPALDYSALEEKIAEVEDTDTSIYTVETAGRFNNALAYAKELAEAKNAESQDDITNMLTELTNAFKALTEKDANYAELEAAKNRFTALNAKEWTVDSYNAAKAAYDAACAVAEGLKISQQATIDAAANELNAKIDDLLPAGAANYADLDKAITDAKALVADHYVDFSGVTTALAAAENVSRDLTANDQAIVDEAANALVAAMGALVPADADYLAVEAAVAKANAMAVAKSGEALTYTDAYIAALNAAVADVEYGLKKADQAKVDEMAAAIDAVIAAPEYRAFDYSKIEAHIAEIEANEESYYDADEYAAYVAAKEDLVWDYTNEQYAQAMLQQSNFLKVTVAAAAAANYDAVNEAIDAFKAKIADAEYEQAGIDAVNAIIDGINWDLNENFQDDVDAYEAAIIEATDALVEVVYELVDYTRLDAAIKAAKEVDADLYTAASYHDVTTALYTAESIGRDLIKDEQQDFVDEVAKTLEDAIAALEKKANYEALDAAILRAGSYDQNSWTEATWAVVVEKLAAANDVDRELGETQQDVIDEATNALNDALEALEAKEVVSSISTVNWIPSEDTHNTFTVAVNGRPAMIQFIEMDGGTRTYDRYNKNVKITSYNAAGEEVNSLDRSVAYEVWEIYTNLIGPDVQARAKYLVNNSYVWETEKYSFTVETLEPTYDVALRSITPAAESGKKGAVSTTVVVGKDAEGIRFVMDNNTTCTYYADKATVLENGDLQFVGNAWMNNDGMNVVVVKVLLNGVWSEIGYVYYTVE